MLVAADEDGGTQMSFDYGKSLIYHFCTWIRPFL